LITKRPSIQALLVLAAFVAACFAMTVYMWIDFGGPIPFKPEGYRMYVAFKDSRGLVTDTDVRIAGISVGSVKSINLNPKTNQAVAELDINDQYAPRPADTEATLRTKSLLGETYIELSPGTPNGPTLPEGGTLASSQVQESVSLGDVIGTFDPATRQALTSWLTDQGEALNGGAPSISSFLAALQPLAENTGVALGVVRDQQSATSSLIRDGGSALSALSERTGQFGGLVESSARVFHAMGTRNADLAQAIRILPTFLDETKSVSERLAKFSAQTTPLVKQLQPAAEQFSPGLRQLQHFAPDLRRVMIGIKPLTRVSRSGVPALGQIFDRAQPLLERARPYLGGVEPIINYANAYRRELAGAVGNLAATTQATLPPAGGGTPLHYVRGALPINLEALAAFPKRFGSSRTNPYPKPGQALELGQGLPQFGDYLCVNRPLPSLSPAFSSEITTAIGSYYTDDPANPNPVTPPSPPCRSQGALGPAVGGGPGYFPNLQPLP
jgi:phospholipid/cholesterol/gamma-HCH transport system substrate-binding protein